VKGAEPLHDVIVPWDPHVAAERFLDRFAELKPAGLPAALRTLDQLVADGPL
jgi:hypothetical protein